MNYQFPFLQANVLFSLLEAILVQIKLVLKDVENWKNLRTSSCNPRDRFVENISYLIRFRRNCCMDFSNLFLLAFIGVCVMPSFTTRLPILNILSNWLNSGFSMVQPDNHFSSLVHKLRYVMFWFNWINLALTIQSTIVSENRSQPKAQPPSQTMVLRQCSQRFTAS